MAVNLFLCKYPENSTDRYIEDTGDVIEGCFIDKNTLQDLENYMCEQETFDKEGKKVANTIQYIKHDEIKTVIEKMQKLFLKRYGEIPRKELEKNPELLTTVMREFRTITNIVFLLQIKYYNYLTDNRVLVQLG